MYFAALLIGALVGAASAQNNVCHADYCKNNGVCVIVVGNPSCACAPGFIGKNCETAEVIPNTGKACDNDPCLNGGVCTANGDELFTCACRPGFAGTVCQMGVSSGVTANPALTSAPVYCPRQKTDKDNLGCAPAEVVFMIEYARGDSYFDVDHEGDFIKRIIDIWQVNDQNIRIGVVTYHDTVSEVIHIDDYPNKPDELKNRITQLTRRLRPTGTNDLGKALEYVRNVSFTNSRPNAEKIVIPIVHMMPNATRAGILDAARALRRDCVTIIGLGVRNSRSFGLGGQTATEETVDQAIMSRVVTNPASTHYIEYRDYSALESGAAEFNDDTCS